MSKAKNQAIRELRRAPGRLVEIDPAAKIVTKSFLGRTLLARLGDRFRAHREARILELVAKLGIATPRVLGVGRGADRSWQVHIEAIEGARTAEQVLTEAPGREHLVEQLAQLLASLQASGIDQPDLHSKNALVDSAGSPWAIDFHAARVVGPLGLGPRLLLRDLISLASSHRELLDLRLRQRFFLAWLQALPENLAASLAPTKQLARDIEAAAVIHRREVCLAYAKTSSRFFRISGSCRAVEATDFGLEKTQGDFHASAKLLARRGAKLESLTSALRGESLPGLVAVHGDLKQVQFAWGAVAQIAAHGLDGPRPLLLDRRNLIKAVAWFDFHLEGRGLGCDAALEELALPAHTSERAFLDQELKSKGLCLKNDLPASFRRTNGTLMLSATARLGSINDKPDPCKKVKRRVRRERFARVWPTLTAHPLRPLTCLLLSAVAKAGRFSPIERQLRRNLSIGLSKRKASRLTPHIRKHMARLAIEWGQLGSGSNWLASKVEFDDSVRYLDEALAKGQGVIVITPHLGNWELLAAAIVARGARGAVVGRRRLRDPSAHILEELRARAGVKTLPQDSSPRDLLRRLANGEVIGLLPDLEVQRLAGIRMDFLGRDALVMTAPVALARAAKLPLLPARCVMDESSGSPRGPYRLSFEAPIPQPASREETRAVTAQWVALFERWIRESPSQWLWVHDRWRTPPSAADKVPLSALRQVQADSKNTD